MVFSPGKIALGDAELLEHRVIGARLQFVLRIADHGPRITQEQNAVRPLAAIRAPGERNPVAFFVLLHPTDELVSAHGDARTYLSDCQEM